MGKKSLLYLLAGELAVIVAVLLVFRLIPEKNVASIVASLLFIGLGVTVLLVAVRSEKYLYSGVFWLAQLHLFFSSIPMLVLRLLYMDTGFDDITIFGIPGPEFHKWATKIYLGLIIATIVDLWRAWKRSEVKS